MGPQDHPRVRRCGRRTQNSEKMSCLQSQRGTAKGWRWPPAERTVCRPEPRGPGTSFRLSPRGGAETALLFQRQVTDTHSTSSQGSSAESRPPGCVESSPAGLEHLCDWPQLHGLRPQRGPGLSPYITLPKRAIWCSPGSLVLNDPYQAEHSRAGSLSAGNRPEPVLGCGTNSGWMSGAGHIRPRAVRSGVGNLQLDL